MRNRIGICFVSGSRRAGISTDVAPFWDTSGGGVSSAIDLMYSWVSFFFFFPGHRSRYGSMRLQAVGGLAFSSGSYRVTAQTFLCAAGVRVSSGSGESAPVSELVLFVQNRQYRGIWVG